MLLLQVDSNKKLIMGSIQLPSFLGKSSAEIVDIADFASKNAKLFLMVDLMESLFKM